MQLPNWFTKHCDEPFDIDIELKEIADSDHEQNSLRVIALLSIGLPAEEAFPRFDQQLIASQAEARLRVHLWPRRDEYLKLVGWRCLDDCMFSIGADFRDSAVIDRARRPCEIRENILIIRPAPVRDHRLDQADFPTLKFIAPPTYCHGQASSKASWRTASSSRDRILSLSVMLSSS